MSNSNPLNRLVPIRPSIQTITLGVSLAWVGCIFYLAVAPLPPDVPTLEPGSTASLGHYGTNLVFGGLVYLLIGRRSTDVAGLARDAVMSVGLVVLLGVVTEGVQLIVPERTASIADLLYDGAGAATGVVAVILLERTRASRFQLSAVGSAGTTVLIGLVIVGGILWTAEPPYLDECGPNVDIVARPGSTDSPGGAGSAGSGVRVTDGLVVYYDFSEGTGEVVHDVGGVGAPLDLVILDRDKARWILGSKGIEFVDAGTAIRSRSRAAKIYDALTASNQFTVEAWVVPSDLEDGDPPRRIVAVSAGTWRHQVNLHLGHDGPDGVFRVRTTCDYYISASTARVFTGTGRPTHLVASYDGSTMRTVVDGVALETFDGFDGTFGNWDPDYPLVIGNEATLTRSFLGTIMLVAVYDRALSDEEIRQNFEVGPDG